MYGDTYSKSLSHSFGPMPCSRSSSIAIGISGDRAESRSLSVGIGYRMPVSAEAAAHSQA